MGGRSDQDKRARGSRGSTLSPRHSSKVATKPADCSGEVERGGRGKGEGGGNLARTLDCILDQHFELLDQSLLRVLATGEHG